MKLPGDDALVVEEAKIVGYLLNPAHRYGASKSRFFTEFGFRAEEWQILADALREHGQRHEVGRTKQTVFEPRFEVDGELTTPDGRLPLVRTVWQQERIGHRALPLPAW